MSSTDVRGGKASSGASATKVDLKLEVVIIPVSDVDRSKRFYESLGWRLDADFVVGDDFRIVQFTPPGSGCSIGFGKGVTAVAPGSAKGLELVASDIEAARAELVGRGVDVSEVFHGSPFSPAGADQRPGPRARQLQVLRLLRGSRWQPVAAAGGHGSAARPRRLRPDDVRRPRRTWRARCGALRSLTASTRSAPASTTRTGPTGTPSTWCASRPAEELPT